MLQTGLSTCSEIAKKLSSFYKVVWEHIQSNVAASVTVHHHHCCTTVKELSISLHVFAKKIVKI